MSTNFIISQVIVVIYYIIFAISYLTKSHKRILIFQVIELLLLSGVYFFLSAWTGLILNVVSLTRVFVYIYLNKRNPSEKRNKLDWAVLIIFIIVGIVTTILTYEAFYSLFALGSCLLFTISTWQKNVKVFRIFGILSSITEILYNYFIGSTLSIIFQSIVLLIDLINIIRIYGLKKEELNF